MSEDTKDLQVNKGIALKQSHWDLIDKLAQKYKVTSHALAKLLLLQGLKSLQEGKFKVMVKDVKTLSYPEIEES